MKSLIAAAAMVAFGATSAAAACGWSKADPVADLDVKTDKQTAMQSAPADAGTTPDRTADTDRSDARLQLAVEPRAEDADSN
jgi:hypothetical protein